jgi:hypothetical protein
MTTLTHVFKRLTILTTPKNLIDPIRWQIFNHTYSNKSIDGTCHTTSRLEHWMKALLVDCSKMDYSWLDCGTSDTADTEDHSAPSTSEIERMHSAARRKTTPNHNEASENREVHDDNHHHRTKPAKRQRSENQEVDDHIDPLMQNDPHTILRNCSIVIG